MAELERVVDAGATLARERAQEGSEWEDEQECPRLVDRRHRREQGNGGERRVHGPGEGEVADEHARRDPVRDPGVDRRAREVEDELRAEREQEEGPEIEVGLGCPGRGEDERRPERVPRVAEPDEDAFEVDPPLGDLRDVAEQHPGRDAERHEVEREQEQHRHEDELGRDREARADLELDLVHERVGRDQTDDDGHVRAARGLEEEGERDGGDEERAAGGDAPPHLARREPGDAPAPAVLDQTLVDRVEVRSRAHPTTIGTRTRARSLERGILLVRSHVTRQGDSRRGPPEETQDWRHGGDSRERWEWALRVLHW